MSKVHKEEIICPKCQTKGEFDLWESMNVDLDPELRDKIFSEEAFIYECPNCGHRTCFPYSTLYHDMERHFMLFFDFFKPKDYNNEPIRIPNLPIIEDYTYRHVIGLWRLKEKILILERDLNDIAIERMKYVLTHIIHPELAEKKIEVYFGDANCSDEHFSEEGAMIFWYHNENDESMQLVISMDSYYEHCKACELDPRMKVEECINVDEDWIDHQLKKGIV